MMLKMLGTAITAALTREEGAAATAEEQEQEAGARPLLRALHKCVLRAEASLSSELVGELPAGAVVHLLEEQSVGGRARVKVAVAAGVVQGGDGRDGGAFAWTSLVSAREKLLVERLPAPPQQQQEGYAGEAEAKAAAADQFATLKTDIARIMKEEK